MHINKGERSSPSPLEMFFTFEDTINQTIKSRQRGWVEDFFVEYCFYKSFHLDVNINWTTMISLKDQFF